MCLGLPQRGPDMAILRVDPSLDPLRREPRFQAIERELKFPKSPRKSSEVLKDIETQGKHETARRAKQRAGQIFRHAIGLGFAERDITTDLKGLLTPPIVSHHASLIDPAQVGALMRAIYAYSGTLETRSALQFNPLERAIVACAGMWSPGQRLSKPDPGVILRDRPPRTGSVILSSGLARRRSRSRQGG